MHYDSVIIGFGKAGKTLAADLATKKQKVALIEKSSDMYGGTCINVGCIPSKFLIHNSEFSGFEPTFKDKQNYYKESVLEKRQVVSFLRNKNYQKLIDAGVEVIDGTASFVDNHTIHVNNADLTADKIFINTGSTPILPAIKGINGKNIYTSDTLMNLEKLPEHLIIVGGGYIGLEFAFMYARFGSKITILQDSKTFLPREDSDLSSQIFDAMTGLGIEFRPDVAISEFKSSDSSVLIETNQGEFKADAILIATGRRANTGDLNLAKTTIQTAANGSIITDEHCCTSVPNIYAMGDVCGGLQFTYISLDDYRVVKSFLFDDGKYTRKNRKNVPYSVFIFPSYSRVGINEQEAQNQNIPYKTSLLRVAAIPKARAIKQTTGIMKALINPDNHKILGAMLFCPESFELINQIKMAMDNEIPFTTLRDQVYTHPTMSEAFNDLFSVK